MLKEGFKQAKAITRHHAHTFYLTSFFLPKDKRLASYVIYAVCRLSDESVDRPALNDTERKNALETIRQKIDLAFSDTDLKDPLLFCFRKTIHKYSIPKEYFDELLDGMAMDLAVTRYQNFHELYDYCYKVAGIIGLIMTTVFGAKNPKAEKHAIEMGIALQLTNILRDIKEDFARGRIYLPQTEMKRFEMTDADIARETVDERFKYLMRFQIERARDYFCRASQGLKLIRDTKSRFTALLILEFYAKILNEIEENGFDVYTKRVFVPWYKKFLGFFSLLGRFLINSLSFRS